jgi:hypothetical protein
MVLPVYIVHRYRFAQGTIVPGILQAYSLRMHWLILLIVIYYPISNNQWE